MTDQPALGLDGQLLDASKIKWYNDPDDAEPIRQTTSVQVKEGAVFKPIPFGDRTDNRLIVLLGQRSRPIRAVTGTRLAEAIAAEKLDEFGNPTQVPRQRLVRAVQASTGTGKRKQTTADTIDTDAEDETFISSVVADGSESSDGSESDAMEISNEEV